MSRKFDSPVETQMAVALFKSPLGRDYPGGKNMEGKQSSGRRQIFVQTDTGCVRDHPGSKNMEGKQSSGRRQSFVQTDTGCVRDHPGGKNMEGKQSSGRRQIFVQTDTGCVLGMEVDRSDNAHTVKRRLQLALNVPTEEISLTFGDRVLKNDLSDIPKVYPLLLTRNLLHRSSSTPCLSPTGKDLQQRDRSGPIEILGHSDRFSRTKPLVKDVVKGIQMGVDPIPVHGGLGGAYYFRNRWGENVAIVKPTDEEPFAPNNPKGFVGKALGQPGLKCSVRVGETGVREVAAYLLDYDHFANVPPTALVKITHSIFNVNNGMNGNNPEKEKPVSKIASFQQYIPHNFDASDHGTSSFPVASVHRIGILDIRILNTDRHGGNLLVRKVDGVGRFGDMELIPIDHGLCLPETLEDPYFEWIHWPQASIPFSDDEIKYINSLNPFKDCEMLRMELPMIREACLRVLVLCTLFLKEAAAFGLCLAEIGEMMSREFRCGEEEPSELELLCMEARRSLGENDVLSPKSLNGDSEFQFDMDYEDVEFDCTPKMTANDYFSETPFHHGIGALHCRNPLSKLEECIDEEGEEGEDKFGEKQERIATLTSSERSTMISKLSTSLKHTMLSEKNPKFVSSVGTKLENGYLMGGSSGHRSATEQLPASVNFVKLADMNNGEWSMFLDTFQELLYQAFAKRKLATIGQRQRQRLGTSCKF